METRRSLDDLACGLFFYRLEMVLRLRRSRKKKDRADAELLLAVAKAALVEHAQQFLRS